MSESYWPKEPRVFFQSDKGDSVYIQKRKFKHGKSRKNTEMKLSVLDVGLALRRHRLMKSNCAVYGDGGGSGGGGGGGGDSITCVTMTMDFLDRAQQQSGIHTKKENTNIVRHIHRHVSMLRLQSKSYMWRRLQRTHALAAPTNLRV